jgi:hypothetical protein
MRIPGPAAWVLGWFASFRSRPVVLSSPHPPSECLRRLATVTSQRGYAWYFNSKNIGRPDPQLRGDVDPSRILVARFQNSLAQNSFVPWLDIRPEPSAEGGTILTGRIGLHPAAKVLLPVLAAGGGLVPLSGLVAGVAQLVSGRLIGALPFVLIPLALGAGTLGFNVAGLRSLEREIPKLIQDMNGILGSGHDGTVHSVLPGK